MLGRSNKPPAMREEKLSNDKQIIAGRKAVQPTKIVYQEAEKVSPERLESTFDYIFRKTVARLEKMYQTDRRQFQAYLDTLNNN